MSRQVLAVPKILKQPNGDAKEIKEFRSKVAADQRHIKTLWQQRWKEVETKETDRRNELTSVLVQALQPSTEQQTLHDTSTMYRNTKIGNNPIFEVTGKINTKCQSMISDYKSFEAMITQMAGEQNDSVTDTWLKDVQEAEEKLAMGQEVALRKVKKVLMGKGNGHGGDEEGEYAGLNYELYKGLSYAERGVKRMVKGLPKDEMD
ncbi:hypothetical protein P280DRAFT_497531 [Massarina eburnea CBS 473.64]|uniref:Uncharacterized protein n=1 Tax=Massarina eburnea CBS 473.64 TaxID=1395130 RepID=A0A6A6S6H7_9PLEO|nr:hypothetical protein P280DRAFT_497531 [Massarina eburnea CBS 473.64]